MLPIEKVVELRLVLEDCGVHLRREDVIQTTRAVYRSCHVVQALRGLIQHRTSQDLLPHCLWAQQGVVLQQKLLPIGDLEAALLVLVVGVAERTLLIVIQLLNLRLLFLFIRVFSLPDCVLLSSQAAKDVVVLLDAHVILLGVQQL
jgi:hypothetical protein